MHHPLMRTLLLVWLCLLAACSQGGNEPVPGKTTLHQLLEQMGQPSQTWSEGDGSLLMEFTRVNDGAGNYMAKVSPGGVLVSLQQVLTEANVQGLQEGMSQEQVRRQLGSPARVSKGAGGEVWTWPLGGGRPAEWQVDAHFGATGTLLEVHRSHPGPTQAASSSAMRAARAGQTPHS